MRTGFLILAGTDVVVPVPITAIPTVAVLHLTALAGSISAVPSPLPASIIECFPSVTFVIDVRLTVTGGR